MFVCAGRNAYEVCVCLCVSAPTWWLMGICVKRLIRRSIRSMIGSASLLMNMPYDVRMLSTTPWPCAPTTVLRFISGAARVRMWRRSSSVRKPWMTYTCGRHNALCKQGVWPRDSEARPQGSSRSAGAAMAAVRSHGRSQATCCLRRVSP